MEQALKIDPKNTDALAGDAFGYFLEYQRGRELETDYGVKVLAPADQAIAIAPDTLWAYYAKGAYLNYSHRADKAIDAFDAGLAINSNFAPLWPVRGVANVFLGRCEQAKSDLLQLQRLSPRDPFGAIRTKYLGDAELGLGRFEAATEDYHEAMDLGFKLWWPYANLAAASALAGKMDEAKIALAEARRLQPRLTVKWYRLTPEAFAPAIPNLFDGLRKAGLPEE